MRGQPNFCLRQPEEDEYFSDGLADEHPGQDPRAARGGGFSQGCDRRRVGTGLNVATVLEGSVRKSGNRMRISVRLVKVADGYHLWSETCDRTLEDIRGAG